jgi:hypothetical protein
MYVASEAKNEGTTMRWNEEREEEGLDWWLTDSRPEMERRVKMCQTINSETNGSVSSGRGSLRYMKRIDKTLFFCFRGSSQAPAARNMFC